MMRGAAAFLLAVLTTCACEAFLLPAHNGHLFRAKERGSPWVCATPPRRLLAGGLAGGVRMDLALLGRASRGVLRIGEEVDLGIDLEGPRCTNTECKRPFNHRFYEIGGSQRAGAQDWSTLEGQVLCHACYNRYRERGTLESFKVLGGKEKRCEYAECERPEKSTRYYHIDGASRAGSQDWGPVDGKVLCDACYRQYSRRGTLQRDRGRQAAEGDEQSKRCSYDKCANPTKSLQFYRIQADTTAGGQDWSCLAGQTLCAACYQRYQGRGTLERDRLKPLSDAEERCTFEGCQHPTESYQFYRIFMDTAAGGQDWRPVADHVLCNACYKQYRSKGTLQRYRTLAHSEKQCTYAECKNPNESIKFYKVHEQYTAGGQNWSGIAGNVLCNACYRHYMRHGTLERRKKAMAI